MVVYGCLIILQFSMVCSMIMYWVILYSIVELQIYNHINITVISTLRRCLTSTTQTMKSLNLKQCCWRKCGLNDFISYKILKNVILIDMRIEIWFCSLECCIHILLLIILLCFIIYMVLYNFKY